MTSHRSRASERTPSTDAPKARLMWRGAGAFLLATVLVATAVAATTNGSTEANAAPAAGLARSAASTQQLSNMADSAFDKAIDERDQRIQREKRLDNEARWYAAAEVEAQRQKDVFIWNAAVAKNEQERADREAAARRAAEQKAAEQRAIEQKVADERAAEQRAANQRAAEQKAAEQKAAPQKAAPAPAAASSGGGSGSWSALAQCESGGNWAANTGNGYYGGLQFSLSTWRAHGGVGMPHQQSAGTQIAVAQRVKNSQGWGAWPACSRKVGLR